MVTITRARGLGLLLAAGAFLLAAAPVQAANLYLFPESAVKSAGTNFTVSIYVNSSDQPMNAVAATLDFPSDKLQVVSLAKDNSIVNLWVQEPSFSNQDGKIRFEGVVLNPGFQGSTGRVIAVTFRPRTAGAATVKFSAGSILANDGEGTNILTAMGGGSYILQADAEKGFPETAEAVTVTKNLPQAPLIRSNTHPLEDKWYNVRNLELSWDIPPGVDGVSYALDDDPKFALVPQGRGLLSNVAYDITSFRDGIWYFHLRFHTAAGWGPVSRRAIKIDFTSPTPPLLTRRNADDPTSPQPVYEWKSNDLTSGISTYQMKLGDGEWFEVGMPTVGGYPLPLQAPGEHQLTVRAIDEAGNVSDGGTIVRVQPVPSPKITDHSAKVVSPLSPFVARGEALPNSNVLIYLREGSRVVSFGAQTNDQGLWEGKYEESIPSGMWAVSARTVDARGALSLESDSVMTEIVSPWLQVGRFLAKTLAILAIVLVILGLILAGAYLSFGRSVLYRMKLRKEFYDFKAKIRQELLVIEKSLESLKQSGKVDASSPAFRDAENRLKGQISQLVSDVKQEIKLLDEG